MKKGSIFPAGKIKKIMQQNQEVGKLSNVVPHLIERSLQIFLDALTDKVNQIATNYDLNKVQTPIIKKALQEMDNYQFMRQCVQDLQDFEAVKKKKSQVKSQKLNKKKSDKKQGDKQNKKGKKKTPQSQKSIQQQQQYQQQQNQMKDQ